MTIKRTDVHSWCFFTYVVLATLASICVRGGQVEFVGGIEAVGAVQRPRQVLGVHDGSPARGQRLLMRKEVLADEGIAVGSAHATLHSKTEGEEAEDDVSFYIRETKQTPRTLEGWPLFLKKLNQHKNKVDDESKARFSIATLDMTITEMEQLPTRSIDRPYLLWGYDRAMDNDYTALPALIARRGDILVVGYDLRPAYNNSAEVLPGVTVPPPRFFPAAGMHTFFDANCNTFGDNHPEVTEDCNLETLRKIVSPELQRRFFLTFRGENNPGIGGTSNVRPELAKAFPKYTKDDVLVQMKEQGKPIPNEYNTTYEDMMRNSSYVLVPRGHGRWTYRLSETVGACAIPVIMSDGMTLPYEELIDWQNAAIRLPENFAALGEDKITSALSRDPVEIRKMRRHICDINDKYFASMEKRTDALLHAASVKSARVSASRLLKQQR